MAHVAKYTRGSVGGLTSHFERRKKENGEYYEFNNQDIDYSRTDLNYNLAGNEDQREFIKDRLSEVKCLNRKDVNVMCSWVITAPKVLKDDEYEQFFKSTYDFLSKRYGEKNVISSYVHMDEATPHMHFAFIPVTLDKKKNIEKVSAKEVLNKRELQVFHDELSNHMNRVFGRDIGIRNQATIEGNKSIDELKRGTALNEVKKIKKKEQELLSSTKVLDQQIQKKQTRLNELNDEIKSIEIRIMKSSEIHDVTPQKGLMGTIKGVTIEDIERLKLTAHQYHSVKYELDKIKNLYEVSKKSTKDKIKDNKELEKYYQIGRKVSDLPEECKEVIKKMLNDNKTKNKEMHH